MISDLTIEEIELAREEIRKKLNEAITSDTKTIFVNNEVINLAKIYILLKEL